MSKNGLTKFVKNTSAVLKKHQPVILTGLGITGFFTMACMAVSVTPKALDRMAEIKEDHAEDTDKKAYAKDVVKKVVPLYIPAAVVGGLSTACVIGANKVNSRRTAALATAYSLSESALKEYQEKVIETVGEKKEQAIRDAVAKDTIDRNPVSTREVILTEKGNTLCYDGISGRYFKSDIDTIRKIENELNRRMISEMYISLNEFYDEIGLSHVDLGEDLGWNVDRGFIELGFSSHLTDDGTPCLAINYKVVPRYGYDS